MGEKVNLLLREVSALKKDQQDEDRPFLVMGQPGSGKSTFISHFFRKQQEQEDLERQIRKAQDQFAKVLEEVRKKADHQ